MFRSVSRARNPFTPNFHTFPPHQIIYLTLGLLIFALISTFIARRRPRGPQPAAYGHLQTLANLVDEWSSTMWWGHKSDDKVICHAGESFEIFIRPCYSVAYPQVPAIFHNRQSEWAAGTPGACDLANPVEKYIPS
jgi:hypothetical protein